MSRLYSGQWAGRRRYFIEFCSPTGTKTRLISLQGDVGIEVGSFLVFLRENRSNKDKELKYGQLPATQLYHYPATTLLNRAASKPSNEPRYLLPATAYMLAKDFGLESCVEAVRHFSRHPPLPAAHVMTYCGALVSKKDGKEINLIYRQDNNHDRFHIIAVQQEKMMVGMTGVLAFFNNFPEPVPPVLSALANSPCTDLE